MYLVKCMINMLLMMKERMMSEENQDTTLISEISKMYSEYGRYINKFRSFPYYVDGLKLVERRVLYSEYLTARKKLTKSAEVVGFCIGKLHPHGDASTYGTLVQLVNNGLSDYNGNFGTDIGMHSEPAAAMRYTEVKMKREVEDLAFQLIDYVPKESLELPMEEPIYLPTKLPFCLLAKSSYCQGIGFGYRTYIPSYSKEDLIKRLEWLLGRSQTEPVIKPLTDCVYGNTDDDFRQILTTGKGKLLYRGRLEVDKENKSVIIRSISPSKTFTSLLNNLKNDIQVQKNIGFIDESHEDKTKVRFTLIKRGQSLDRLLSKLNILVTGSVTFECNMCDDDGNIILVSVDQMLLNAYNMYKSVNQLMLQDNINKCQTVIDELKLVAKIKQVLPKWLKQHPDDIDLLIQGVNSDTQIDFDTIKQLFDKYTIPKFIKCKTDTTDKENEKNEYLDKLNNIDEFVWSMYN